MNLRVIKFFFEEALISLRQNSLMAFISILTISISLVILSVFVLIFINTNAGFESLSKNVTITIFLDKNITPGGIGRVQDQLGSITGIKSSEFISKETAWIRFKSKFQYQEDLVSLVQGNPLPDSFVIKVNEINKLEEVVRELRLIDGVQEVRYGKEVAGKFRKFLQIFNWIGGFVVGILLVATFLITVNTINLTIIAKRQEVLIMKLVGATNRFIRWCFLFEGIIIGLLGSLLAIAAVDGLMTFVSSRVQESYPFMLVFFQGVDLVTLDSVLLGSGLFIGLAGSLLSIANLLRVMLKNK